MVLPLGLGDRCPLTPPCDATCQLSGKNLKLASALHKLHIVDDQLGTGSNSSHSDGASSPMGQTLSTTTTRFMMSETGRANGYGQTGRRGDDRDEGMQAFNVKYVESRGEMEREAGGCGG